MSLLSNSPVEKSSFEESKNIIQTISDNNTYLISLSFLLFFVFSLFFHKGSSIRSFSLFNSNSQIVYAKSNNIDFEVHNLLQPTKFLRIDLTSFNSSKFNGISSISLYKNKKLIQTLKIPFSSDNSINCNLFYLKKANYDHLTINTSIEKSTAFKDRQLFQFSVTTFNNFFNHHLEKFYFLCFLFSTFSLIGFLLLHVGEYSSEQKIIIALSISCIIKNIFFSFNFNNYLEFISSFVFYSIYILLIIVVLNVESRLLFFIILILNCFSQLFPEFIVYETKQFLISISQMITAIFLIILTIVFILCFINSLSSKYQHKYLFYYFIFVCFIISFAFKSFICNISLITQKNSLISSLFFISPFLDTFSTFLFAALFITLPSTYIQLNLFL